MDRRIALSLVLLVTALAPAVANAQGGGTITGVISTKATSLKPIRVTMDQSVCGNELPDEAVVVDGTGHLANAIVSIVGVRGKTPIAATSVMNEKCRFQPRVQIVAPKATVTATSSDRVLHTTNFTTESGQGIINLAVPVPGIKIPVALDTPPGLVRIVCNTHPWMRGFILVTNDMAVVSGADGKFTLRDVPPGTYELRIWHESLKGTAQKVTVVAGQTATVNFELR